MPGPSRAGHRTPLRLTSPQRAHGPIARERVLNGAGGVGRPIACHAKSQGRRARVRADAYPPQAPPGAASAFHVGEARRADSTLGAI